MFNHGVDIDVAAIGRQPVPFADISTVGVIGTAPDADPLGAFALGGNIQHNEPFHLTSLQDAKDLGDNGTLPAALKAIYSQGDVNVIAVIIEEGADDATTRENFIGSEADLTGVYAFQKAEAKYDIEPRILCAPSDLINSRVQKADISGAQFLIEYAPNAPWTAEPTVTYGKREAWRYDHVNGRTHFFDGATGSLDLPAISAFAVNLSREPNDGESGDVLVTAVKYQYSTDGGGSWDDYAEVTGNWTVAPGATAVTVTGITGTKPTAPTFTGAGRIQFRFIVVASDNADLIIITPTNAGNTFSLDAEFDATFTSETANGLALSLLIVAEKLRAVAVIDAPNTYTNIAEYARDFDDSRAYLVAPKVRNVLGEPDWASGYAAGLIAVNDATNGFWFSPSNMPLKGVSGQDIPIDFKQGSNASRAATLNNQNVTTVIRKNGFKLWGNRMVTTAPGLNFITARRIIDLIVDSLQNALFNQVDRPITRDLIDGISETVNGFLRQMEARNAIAGGECFPDPDLNSAQSLANGEVHFSIMVSPTPPAESIKVRVLITDQYLEEILAA